MRRTTWPLFWCLKPKCLAKLIQWYWDNYGFLLEIPPPLDGISIDTAFESLEEIDRLMRQKPHYPKGVKWRG